VHQRTSLPPFLGQGIDLGGLEISPVPDDTQYTTSAIDLFLGDEFHVWDDQKLKFEGFTAQLDLSQQTFAKTARAFLVPVKKQDDGSVIFPHSATILGTCSPSPANVFTSTKVVTSLPQA